MSWKRAARFLRRIHVRLTLYYAICLFAIASANSAFLYYRLSHKLVKQTLRFLRYESQDITALGEGRRFDLERLRRRLGNRDAQPSQVRLTGRVVSPNGEVLVESAHFRDLSYPVQTESFRRALAGQDTPDSFRAGERRRLYQLYTTPVLVDGRVACVLQLSMSLRSTEKVLKHFMSNLLISLAAVVVLGIGLGGAIARRSLAHVGQMSATARHITARRLADRIPIRNIGDELDELAGTLNLMLDGLEDSFQRMAQFSAGAAHELRTPVATLRAAAEAMVKGAHDAPDYQEFAEKILVHCDRFSRLINDLLLLYRSESNPDQIPFSTVQLNTLLDEIGVVFAEVAQLRPVGLAVRADTDVVVSGDGSMLRRLFSNVIDNAIKFTPEHGSISVELFVGGEWATVQVKDTGVGIAKRDLPKAFDRFWRADQSRSRETGGAGLGLSIAKSIAELHRGRIAIESELGKGTSVIVSLPMLR